MWCIIDCNIVICRAYSKYFEGIVKGELSSTVLKWMENRREVIL